MSIAACTRSATTSPPTSPTAGRTTTQHAHARTTSEGCARPRNCLRWLDHLPGPADEPRTRDHWARGIHLLALGDPAATSAAWERSLVHAETTARDANKSTAISVDGDFPVILASGYLALIRWIEGAASGERRFRAAIDAFLDQVPDETRRGAAELGIGQLQKVRTKYGP
jgi:hypothetical protein